jgi:DNA-directed RNA polymerase subunit RPC12/RpoP
MSYRCKCGLTIASCKQNNNGKCPLCNTKCNVKIKSTSGGKE